MSQFYPLLKIKKPDGREYVVELENLICQSESPSEITIGRQENNHIVLSDPQKNISRQHCYLRYVNSRWWIIDRGSANGTFVKRDLEHSEIDIRSEELFPLKNGDDILILGELNSQEEPLFWRLTFIDPGETNQVLDLPTTQNIEYSLSQQKLFITTSRSHHEIILQDKELALIDYMSRQNRANGDRPVVCEYEDLIQAIWQENAFGVDKLDIHHLVWRIRHKIESDSGESRFLKTVRGRGYRLEIKILS